MTAPIDPLLQQRLSQLSGRRPGTALPPPTVAKSTAKTAAAKTGRRAKPARSAKLSALAISATTTLGLAVAFAHDDTQIQASGSLTLATTPPPPAVPPAAPAAVPAAPGTTVVAAVVTPAGIADGTYVGNSDRNRWGTVQVQVVYSGGQFSDVQILQYPNADRKSARINQSALPTLVSEALSARSADVNTVSGATYTSKSYRISLQSAIDAATSASGISG
ncbi:MAG: FMN-binding protein [Ilumatobacteraceae bacterium]|nr:FMN-binding protein [Ilumatobacteraceae bacterium]